MPFLMVQYPTGHKAKIEAPSNKPLFKALEDACSRRSLNFEEYTFTHNDHPVDLSLPFRLSGLTNNAYVELVPRKHNGLSTTETAATETIRLGFRLGTGERMVWTGNPRRSLWDIMNELASDHAMLAEEIASPTNPSTGSLAVIYLQQQVIGKQNLQSTSPMDLGVFKGSALFQLNRTFAPEPIVDVKPISCPPETHTLSSTDDSVSKSAASDLPPLPAQPDEDQPMSSENGSSYTQSEFVSPFSVFAERPTQSVFGQHDKAPTTLTHAQQPRSLGDLLGISLEPTEPMPAAASGPVDSFANFQFPKETAGLDLLKNSLDDDDSASLTQSIDRQSLVFLRPNEIGSVGVPQMDLPEEMFEFTEDDYRRLAQYYRSEWQSDQPLTTAEMRRAARMRLYAKYPRAVIRFHWPDGVVVQASFDPRERVSALYEFVRTQLRDPKMEFHLFTTPPKVILKDVRKTLIDLDLVPLAKVYFSSAGLVNAHDVLLPEVVASGSVDNWTQAQEIVSFWMDQMRANSSPDGGTPMDATMSSNSPSEGPSVPPKWFRIGK